MQDYRLDEPGNIRRGAAPRLNFGGLSVISVRFDRLLASTALGLVLTLGSHAGMAQQPDQKIEASVPVPDTSLPPPLTAQDIAPKPNQVVPTEAAKSETIKSEA